MTNERITVTVWNIARPLLSESVIAKLRRLKHGPSPAWGDRPVNPEFARSILANADGRARLRGQSLRPSLDMRGAALTVLRHISNGAAPGRAAVAAVHGLELTRPFHDKRVVELALAIPEDLYVKNGRNRYLACVALRDVFPPEFQTRSRRNDDEIPDFQRMVKSIEPQLLDEIARMERSPELTRYFDFSKIRSLLAARGPEDHNSGWEAETQRAAAGFASARYVEWFRGKNR